MQRTLSKLFGTRNDRVIKGIVPLLEQINALEPELVALRDTDLKARTPAFRQRLENGEPWMICSPRPSRRFARRPSGPWASAITTFR